MIVSISFILILFFLLSFIISTEEKELITFNLAFLYTDEESNINPIDYVKPIQVLSKENQVKIYIRPLKNVYIYLLRKDTSEDLELLFPQKLNHFKSYYTLGKAYYIPRGEKWFTLGTPFREETFFIIASRGRLLKLESLIKKYLKTFQNNTDSTAETRQAVIEHMKKLRLEYSSFTPEKSEIVLIAGEFRGIEEGFTFPALHIEADTFYAKTIRITY